MIEPPSSPCPDACVLDAYVRGEADSELRGGLEAHLDACIECRRVVAALMDAPASTSGVFAQTLESQPAGAEVHGLAPGQVLLDKYEVETLLGAGGMGIVARARHRVLDRPVVIKLLKTPHASEEAVRRFLREARAAAAIESAHVVRVIDAGLLDRKRPYLVLEHLEGRDLAAELSERGRLPAAEAVELALQCAEALALAHARGIVHRDIKPANLFISRDADGGPQLKVLDFGIAKALSDSDIATEDGSLTESSAVIGSPRYMSPEQLQDSSEVDGRTDIWALGAVLYELVSGKPAFDGPNLAVLATKILTQPCTPVRELAPDAPEEVAVVIERCLQKDRAERYASVVELGHALVAASGREHKAWAARFQSPPGTGEKADAPKSGGFRIPNWAWVVVGVVVVLGLALVFRSRPDGPTGAPSAPEPIASLPAASTAPPLAAPPGSALAASPSASVPAPRHLQQVPTRPSPRPAASSTSGKPASSGVDVFSDGLLDRK